jgi:hypothetical protein
MRLVIVGVVAAALGLQAGCQKKSDGAGAGADSGAARLPAGPAAVYQSLFESIDKADLEALSKGEISEKALKAHAAGIEQAIEASKSPTCDFGVDRSQGMMTLLQHTAYVRATARMLRDGAERLIKAGDLDRAAQRSAAVLRMSQQVMASAKCGIEQLVACATAATGADLVNEHPELAKAAWKTDIQAALGTVRQSGALWSSSCLRGELDMIVLSLQKPSLIYLEDSAAADAWKKMSQEERNQAIEKLRAIYAEAIRVWDMPDAESRLKALGERAGSEGVGELYLDAARVRNASLDAKQKCAKAEAVLNK